MQFENSFL